MPSGLPINHHELFVYTKKVNSNKLIAAIEDKAPQIIKIAHILKDYGFLCYVVGGSIRDLLLGRPVSDFDLASDAEPHEVQALFRRTIATGIEHGTITIRMQGRSFEITTFRTDGDYADARHPESVAFVRNIDEDLARRDFTINAFALDPISGEFLDLFGGISDLFGHEKPIIRAIGKPEERFAEDALRIMRAARFAAQLGGSIEAETLEAMHSLASSVSRVSVERIFVELSKLIASKDPIYGMQCLYDIGLASLWGFATATEASQISPETIQRAIELLAKTDDVRVRWALMFMPFDSSERATAALACAKQLKTSKAFRVELVHILSCAEQSLPALSDPSAIRHWLAQVGRAHAKSLWALQCLWSDAHVEKAAEEAYELPAEIHAELDAPLSIAELAIGGAELKAAAIPAGPHMKAIFAEMLEAVLTDPMHNKPEELIALAKACYNR